MATLSLRRLELEELVKTFRLFNDLLTRFATPCLLKCELITALQNQTHSNATGLLFLGDMVDTIKECLDIHRSNLKVDNSGRYYYEPVCKTNDLEGRAAARIVLQQYTNQLLGPLINLAVFGYIRAKFPGELRVTSAEKHWL